MKQKFIDWFFSKKQYFPTPDMCYDWLIAHLPATGLKNESGWISIDVDLPKTETQVIVARPNPFSHEVDILMAYLHDSGESGRSYGKLGESKWLYGKYWSLPAVVKLRTVTHWMPLPSAPEK